MSYMDTADGGPQRDNRNYRDRQYHGRGGYDNRPSYSSRGGRYDRGGRWGWQDSQRDYDRGRGRGNSSRGSSRGGGRQYYDEDYRHHDRYDRDRRPYERTYFPFKQILNLEGHDEIVTAILLDEANSKIYSGSRDGTLRSWNMDGKCENVLDAGGSVTCLYLEPPFLFAATQLSTNGPGVIRVWSIQSGEHIDLNGHTSEVLCMTAANNVLISGGRDATIRLWVFDQSNAKFNPTVCLGSAQGGHSCAVQCLVVERQYLLSADWQGNIKVWDMESMSAIQTVHAHDNVIMELIVYQHQYLLSASLDGCIKVFKLEETVLPGQFFQSNPVYSHPPQSNRRQEEFGGILAMVGTTNNEGDHIILASHDQEGLLRLWSIPYFDDKGQAKVRDCRAIAAGLGLVIVGHGRGQIKVFQWK